MTTLDKNDLSARQHRVHDMIQSVGGYWHPINGLARLLEELGELSEIIHDQSSSPVAEQLAEEFADVWIISTCTANQFNIELYDQQSRDDHLEAGFDTLLVRAGLIARILNYYDGPKMPRSVHDWPSLGEAIRSFHDELRDLAARFDVDIDAAVDKKIDQTPLRDAGRFKQSYDPSTSVVLRTFEEIQQASQCSFARRAKLWGAPAWRADQALEYNVELIVPYLTIFAKAAEREGLDGFVIAPPRAIESEGMDELATWFAQFLWLLIKQDAGDDTAKAFVGVDSPGWQFSFRGVRMFISVFSSVYSAGHPRFSPVGPHILLQPEASFEAFRIGSRYPSSDAVKRSIRRQFAEAGFEYPADLIDQRVEAQIYLLPRWHGDMKVDWWKKLDRLNAADLTDQRSC